MNEKTTSEIVQAIMKRGNNISITTTSSFVISILRLYYKAKEPDLFIYINNYYGVCTGGAKDKSPTDRYGFRIKQWK